MHSPALPSSPERTRIPDTMLNRVPEDDEPVYDEWAEEDELEAEGLYRGSYNRLVLLYTLAPLTVITTIGLLALLPYIAYRDHEEENKYPYSTLIPYPLPELVVPAALFALTHLLRPTLYAIPTLIIPESLTATLLSTALCTLLTTLARMLALTLLLIHPYAQYTKPTWHDPAFLRIWSAGLGWAAAEGLVAVSQGYAGLALYRDVLVPPAHHASPRASTPDSIEAHLSSSSERTPLLARIPSFQSADADTELEHDLDQLLALKARDDLEAVLGIPLVYIPPFIPPLQRLNAVLLSLGLFLILGAAPYLSSTLGALLLVGLAGGIHVLLAALHAPGVLPRVGLHSAAFVGAVVSLGVLFAGLGVWGGVS
ncbi:hypothetical protein C8F01DRAFT_1374274 [Mycena amicta]|nr:hypothetical protein C8F01DRAFT_1374274 [Mycena amicta]